MYVQNWVTQIIKGIGGFLSWEDHEMPTYHNTREEQIAAFVLRCLANPDCEGSREVLDAIVKKRGEAVPDFGTGFRPPWDVIRPEYVACAVDRNGIVYFYNKIPKAYEFRWNNGDFDDDSFYCADYPFRIKSPVQNWRECLWIRPGHQQQ